MWYMAMNDGVCHAFQAENDSRHNHKYNFHLFPISNLFHTHSHACWCAGCNFEWNPSSRPIFAIISLSCAIFRPRRPFLSLFSLLFVSAFSSHARSRLYLDGVPSSTLSTLVTLHVDIFFWWLLSAREIGYRSLHFIAATILLPHFVSRFFLINENSEAEQI